MKTKLFRAGLLPYIVENGEVKFLFMKPADSRYGGDRFQIAKGKIEDGETECEAAVREASEELGLVPENIEPPLYLGDFLGRTSIFLAKIKDKSQFGPPHFETCETAWLTVNQFNDIGRKLHSPIVECAADIVLLNHQVMD